MEKQGLNQSEFAANQPVAYRNIHPSPFDTVALPEEIQVISGPSGNDNIYKIKVTKPVDYNGAYSNGRMAGIVLEKFFKRL